MKKIILDIHFQILGVTRNSTKNEIKTAFRKQSMLYHPDKFSNDQSKWEEAHLKFIQISEAYNLLKNYEPNETFICAKRNNNFHSNNPSSERTDIVRTRVKSSNIFSIGYDPVNKILQVEFKKGSIYEYYDVPDTVYQNFMKAGSKGNFISQLSNFMYKKCN